MAQTCPIDIAREIDRRWRRLFQAATPPQLNTAGGLVRSATITQRPALGLPSNVAAGIIGRAPSAITSGSQCSAS